MQSSFPRRAALLGLVLALLAALTAAPVLAQRHRPGRGGSGGGSQFTVPAGSVAVRGTITALNSQAGTFQLTDQDGLSITLKTSSTTVIQLDGKTAALTDLKTDDGIIVVFDRTTLVASRIQATSPPPVQLVGTITTLDTTGGTVQLTTDHGTAVTLTTNASTKLQLNGKATTLASLAVGDRAAAAYQPADKIALTLAAQSPQTGIATGAITAIDVTAGTVQLTSLVGPVQNLKLTAQTSFRLNGRRVAASAVAVGQLAAVQLATDGSVQVLAAQTPPLINLEGTLSAVDVTGGTLQVTTPGATTITLALGSAVIQRNGVATTADKLVVGDQLLVQYEYRLFPGASRALQIQATGP